MIEKLNPNTEARPGRMLAGLLASENPKGKMELTVTLAPNNGGQALHRAFTIKKWASKDGNIQRLYVQLPDTADWDAGVKPLSPIVVDLATGEVRVTEKDPRNTPLLTFAAKAALHYARTGDVLKPGNGTISVVEATRCGMCGIKLKDPVSIERGIGPECFGKATKSKAISLGQQELSAAPAPEASPVPPTNGSVSEIDAATEALIAAEERIAGGDHSEAAYDNRDECAKWLYKAQVESGGIVALAAHIANKKKVA